MLPVVIRSCPSADEDFLPLSEYQAQTPETFFDGKPVLYFHDESIKAWASREHSEKLFFFSKTSADSSTSPPSESLVLDNSGRHVREEKRVEVFVSSRKLILFSHESGTGIEIPYPTITLHAIQNLKQPDEPVDESSKFAGVYMQLEFPDSGPDDDESFDPIELTLVPYKAADSSHPTVDPLNAERTKALFDQISACSNLNPDPRNEEDDEDDDEFNADHIVFESQVDQGVAIEGLPGVLQGNNSGGLPPPMPGSSGWITEDNVNEFFDEDGNWIGGTSTGGELGDGAGRVRGRDEVEPNDADNDENVADSEVKRIRTE